MTTESVFMPDFTYEIEDIKLAQQGLERINWVRERMPVLCQIKQDVSRTRPFPRPGHSTRINPDAEEGN